MTRLFTGDFSTGNLLQWPKLSNVITTDVTTNYHPGGYPASVVPLDGDCGYCARFELRDGDVPSFGGGERSELFGDTVTDVLSGQTAWYAFSIKFDTTFPADHANLVMPAGKGWGVVGQWHDNHPGGSLYDPILGMGWGGDPAQNPPGYWGLSQSPQSAPGVTDVTVPYGSRYLLSLPMNPGTWHDLILQIKMSADPAVGFVRVWHDGVAQTLLGGTTTFTGQTMPPSTGSDGVTGNKVQLGYYRNALITETGIVYYTGFRMADSQASL